MATAKLTLSSNKKDDDTVLIASQLYSAQGYAQALETVINYMANAENDDQRSEWMLVLNEINLIGTRPASMQCFR